MSSTHRPHGGDFVPSAGAEQHYPQMSSSHGGAFVPSHVSQPWQQQSVPARHGGSFTPMAYQSNNSITPPNAYGQASPQHSALPLPPRRKEPPTWVQPHVQNQYTNQYGVHQQQIPLQDMQQQPQKEGFMAPKTIVHEVVTQITPFEPPQPTIEPKEFPITLKGSLHALNARTSWRWKNQHFYQKPGYVYNDSETKLRHRDFAGRVTHHPRSDRYIHHNDGYLRNMYVSCTDEIYEGPGTSTWKRTYVQKVASRKVRIATWVIDFSYDPESWNDWWIMVLRALPAALAMQLVFWDGKPMTSLRNLYYAPVLYTYHGDAKVWSNMLENRKDLAPLARTNEIYRLLKPRHLCFLNEPSSKQNQGVVVSNVADWEDKHGEDAVLKYLFVAYSTEHFSHGSDEDRNALHEIAETACRAAGLQAYWVACSCMRSPSELEADVFRISDVLRGASKMIIAVGPNHKHQTGKPTTERLLKEWGSRMWTFPEVLLCPGRSIEVYTRGKDLQYPLVVPKNQFASKAWAHMDAAVSRNMIDHFLGNIDLSRLELSILSLQCLYSRQTTHHFKGDQAYALMGLLRLRPQIDQSDTAFQAFSRLSLANDSDRLLERYICTLPVDPNQPWHDMKDAYQSSLWDITPYCQVAGIADQDTVIIDGAWGLSIRWKGFYPIYWSSGPSWKRWFASLLMEWNVAVLILAIFLLATSVALSRSIVATPLAGVTVVLGLIFLSTFFYFWLMTPKLVRIIYGGKFTETQAEVFGFEGHLNAATIERAIFGGNFGRFSWSTNGSPLSRSVVIDGEKFGQDPAKDPEVLMKIKAAKLARPGDTRIFTLVDTYNMQLTLFEAVRPPVTLMFCASEGGMQRAIGCSYEWESQTMYRETVLRMPTTCLNRMDRVPRFRFGLHRQTHPSSSRDGPA